jgi:hypothetical protein
MKTILFILLILVSQFASANLVEVAHDGGMTVSIDLRSFAKFSDDSYMMRAVYMWDKPGRHPYHAVAVTREYNCKSKTYRLINESYLNEYGRRIAENGSSILWEHADKGTIAKILLDTLCEGVAKSKQGGNQNE